MATYEQLVSDIRNRKFCPVYFLTGEEPYFIDKLASLLTDSILPEDQRGFDQQVLYGRDFETATIGPILTQARQFPMMAPLQVIIVREAQLIKKWDNFEKYWQNPAPHTVLCICYKGKANKTHTCFKKINELPGYMESQPLYDNQVNKWITDYIAEWNREAHRSESIRIDPQVVQLLADSLGSDLKRIEMELGKLVGGCPPGTTVIDAALVERNIGISKDYNVFELQNALVAGDVVKANRIVAYFAKNQKEHPIQKELVMVFRFFANLMIYHYLPDKSQYVVAKKLGCSPYQVKDYAAASRRFTKGKTFRIIGYIREADVRSKGFDVASGSLTDREIWQELIFKIMH